MSQMRSRRILTSITLAGLVSAPLALAAPASAAPDGSQVVISEVYVNGGSAGATYTNKYVELFNPSDETLSLDGLYLHYRSSGGTGDTSSVTALDGDLPAGEHYLIQGGSNGANGVALPTPNETSDINPSGTAGVVLLSTKSTALTITELPAADSSANALVVDLVGYGAPNTFENAATVEATGAPGSPGLTNSLNRAADGTDTNDNSADFTVAAPSPTAYEEPPPPPADPATIEQIQGTGDTSPLDGDRVETTGVVTASYPTGGFAGFYLQTPGTGGALPGGHNGSNAVFVFMGTAAADAFPEIGDHVQVTGEVSEFFGLTEVTADVDGVEVLAELAEAVTPTTVAFPSTDATREDLEGMLLAPQGNYTVSDNFNLNNFAEIGLAAGNNVLRQPTDVGAPGSAAAAAVLGQIEARQLKLDDGATVNYLQNATTKAIPLPWLTIDDPIRVGAQASIVSPVIFDFRNSSWKFQPLEQLTADNGDDVRHATFEDTRTTEPNPISGDLKIASFNVLNYFTATGDSVDRSFNTATPPAPIFTPNGVLDCTSFNDRDGNPITASGTVTGQPNCDARGAWDAANLQRQQDKIVAAINTLDADVLSLEEIENSAKFNKDRDQALSALVDALNADAGSDRWAFVPSASTLPTLAEEDVIRNAFIYQKDVVETVGGSKVLIGSTAFANAREPLAQVFRPAGGTYNQEFAVVVNHFKSKSPADPPLPADDPNGNGDKGDGAGAYNGDRIKQAQALVAFADEIKAGAGVDKVFITGDLNSYTQEDPMQVLYDAGYVDLGSTLTNEQTYLFGGLMGSLDHVLANGPAASNVVDADIWNINSVEPIALEYSRYNYNVTNFYAPDIYRSSDHDPLIVGYNVPEPDDDKTFLNIVDINDFHGRIDSNTVKFAGTVEQARAQYGDDNTLFVAAGDNIGASLFASSLADDQPTIDVLNALEMDASAVGNHEFDQGWADLRDDVIGDDGDPAAEWTYLGANVYADGTEDPVLPEYATFTRAGQAVCVIGAVTQETPSLVSPAGVADLDFGDPVEAVNRVAGEIAADCDVIIAAYHDGAAEGMPDGSTLEEEVADSPTFAAIVNETSAEVDAIFTGHTHKQYAWTAPVPGEPGKMRAIVQTGNYGEFVGQVVLAIDGDGEVTTHAYGNLRRSTAADSTLTAAYPRVAEVKTIVDAAIAEANVVGLEPVATISDDITTAYAGGSYGPDGYAGGSRDQRQLESTLGNTVANALRDTLASEERGGAEIGIVNPGGLRAELFYDANVATPSDADGVVNFAEANAVLPFVNNLWSLTLTGAQLKAVLEEQWQTNPDGTIPSRPFLHLGLSDNVDVTLDPAAGMGSHVTSIRIGGVEVDPTANYRIATFSFLAVGGDNFRSFTGATDVRDSGLVDRDAWIDYLDANSPNAPAFDRRQVYGTGVPDSIQNGQAVTFELQQLDLTSLGSPANTTVEVTVVEGGTSTPVESFPVTNGVAQISFTAPTVAEGAEFVLTAQPSGTTVTIPAEAEVVPPAETTVSATAAPAKVEVLKTKAKITATVSAGGDPVAGGTVEVREGDQLLGSGTVAAGRATIALPVFATLGKRTLTVDYLGSDTQEPSSTTVTVKVVKATPKIKVTVKPDRIKVDRTRARLTIEVTAPGQEPSGFVAVELGKRVLTLGFVMDGRTTVTLPRFPFRGKKDLVVEFLGGELTAQAKKGVTIRVV